ncbi:MAG: GrpB family protein [Candidatus Eremiobacteraeota bacterium]|nr:GrpB family protein [Candidatus Eremiobacteraeota bacterium]
MILIGGPERVDIVIAEYDPRWPERYAVERERIATALAENAMRIEHIGSTSVPGLGAKPIVDILVAVAHPDDEACHRGALERAGYVLRVIEPGHRMYRTAERDVHVHVWADGTDDIVRHVAFRDLLRSSADARSTYEGVKRELASRSWDDSNAYAEAKTQVIAQLLG